MTEPDTARPLPDPALFWAHVDRSDDIAACWDWTGDTDKDGYGCLTQKGVHWRAHRAAYELTTGPIPPELHLLHSCDNRRAATLTTTGLARRNRTPPTVSDANATRHLPASAKKQPANSTFQALPPAGSDKNLAGILTDRQKLCAERRASSEHRRKDGLLDPYATGCRVRFSLVEQGFAQTPIRIDVTVASEGTKGMQPSFDRLNAIGQELGDNFEVQWSSPEPRFGFDRRRGFAVESVALVALGLSLGGFLNQLGAVAADGLVAALKKLFKRTAEESARDVYRIQQAQVVTMEHGGRTIAIKLAQGIKIDEGGDASEVERRVDESLQSLQRVREDLLRDLDRRILEDDSLFDYVVTVFGADNTAIEQIHAVNDLLPPVYR